MVVKIKEIKKENVDKEELKKQIPSWYKLLEKAPYENKLRIVVASMYYFIDEKEVALKLLKEAPDENNIDIKEMKAIVYMDLNYYDEALKLLNEILKVDYDKGILDLKVDCLSFLEKFEEVIKTADEYLEDFGNNIDVLNNKKIALEELNYKKQAKEVEKLILDLKPYNKFAVYLPKDQIDEVIPSEIYEKELESCLEDFENKSDDYPSIISIATFLYNLDRIDESIEYLDKIIDEDADGLTKNAKASMFMKFGDYNKALKILNKCTKEDKTNIHIFISKSECLLELEKYEELLECTDEGLKLDKTNLTLWENKFLALVELNRLVEAKEAQDLIFDLEIADDFIDGSLKKAINRFYSEDYKECLNLCYDVLDVDKDNEEAATLMMNTVYLLGDLEEVPRALHRALNCNGGEILTRE